MRFIVCVALLAPPLAACGARSTIDDFDTEPTSTGSGAAAPGGFGGSFGTPSVGGFGGFDGNGGDGGNTIDPSGGGGGSGGSVPCVEEICDGLDNDCNGAVDEADPSLGLDCATGLAGACAPGIYACASGVLSCQPTAPPTTELCDDVDTDCDGLPDPASCPKIVFTTSSVYNGNLSGLSGADTICRAHAESANLQGDFKAWLSDATASAASRLAHHEGPYVLVDGTIVASDWNDLVDGNLFSPIFLTERGDAAEAGTGCDGMVSGGPVWSNTTASGDLFDVDRSCGNWTNVGANQAAFGAYGSNADWSQACTSGGETLPVCLSTAALYCFEQ